MFSKTIGRTTRYIFNHREHGNCVLISLRACYVASVDYSCVIDLSKITVISRRGPVLMMFRMYLTILQKFSPEIT